MYDQIACKLLPCWRQEKELSVYFSEIRKEKGGIFALLLLSRAFHLIKAALAAAKAILFHENKRRW